MKEPQKPKKTESAISKKPTGKGKTVKGVKDNKAVSNLVETPSADTDQSQTVAPTPSTEEDGYYFAITEEIHANAKAIIKLLHRQFGNLLSNSDEPWKSDIWSSVFLVGFLNKSAAAKFVTKVEALSKVIAGSFSTFDDYVSRADTFLFTDRNLASDAKGLHRGLTLSSSEQKRVRELLGDDKILTIARTSHDKSKGGDWMLIFFGQIVPRALYHLAKHVEGSLQRTHWINAELKSLLDAYIQALSAHEITLAHGHVVSTSGYRDEIKLKNVMEMIVDFCRRVSSELSLIKPRSVVIANDASGQIETKLDGIPVSSRSAGGRALITLALLHKKRPFDINDFVELYAGDASGDNHKAFNNAMRQVPDDVKIYKPCGAGYRQTKDVNFEINVGDDSLRKFLEDCYSQEVREKRKRQSGSVGAARKD